MKKQSIIFLGSKSIGYHCFQYLIAQSDALNLDIKGLLCNEKSVLNGQVSLKDLAQQNSIPVINTVDEMPEVDILYSVQYHVILKQKHIDKATQIALNLHMAPLPEYRGCNQFSFALIDKKNEFGTTIHRMDSRIDHGDILFEKRFSIPENCWINDLYELTYHASLELFKETLKDIAAGNYSLSPQQNLVEQRGSSIHYRNEIDKIKVIDLNWEKEKIERHIRATSMPGFEPPYTIIDGKKIYFCSAWK